MALDDYEEALKSYIHDDDKLVTYKWLSKEFEVHVNVAKDILKQYWEKHKNEEKILATFLLIGQLKDRSIRVEVVKELNLNTAKDKFMKVDCEHLYSLQKSLDDVESLAFAGEGDLRYSSIKCNEDYIRTDEEIESLRYIGNISKEKSKPFVSNTTVKPPGKQVDNSSKGKDKFIENKKDDIKEKKEKSVEHKAKEKPETKEKPGESKSESKAKEKSKLKEKSVESKAENKSEAPPEKKVSPTNKSNNSKANAKVAKKLVQSKQTGYNNLFGKASSKPQQSSKPTEDSDNDEKQNNLSDSTKHQAQVSKEKITKSSKENDNKSKDLEKEKSKYSQEKENRNEQLEKKSKNVGKSDAKISNKSKSNAKDNRGTKRNRSQEKNNALSKRKRIVIADSSEDESNKSDNEEEEEPMEVEEESPKVVRQRSPSPPIEKRENGKRMVRKTIDKTFKDVEGYLVTKRVQVYEAASDNDEPEEVKMEEPAKSKPVEVRVKKQTTLMNFFKKS